MNKTIYLCWDRAEAAPQECLDAGLVPCKWVDIPRGANFVNHETYRDRSRWMPIKRTRQWQACTKSMKAGQGWMSWGYFSNPANAVARITESQEKV